MVCKKGKLLTITDNLFPKIDQHDDSACRERAGRKNSARSRPKKKITCARLDKSRESKIMKTVLDSVRPAGS